MLQSVLLAASLTASSIAFAGPTGVPFKATFVTQEQLHPDPAICQTAPYLVGVTTGSGHASHLGATTGISSDCVTPTSAYTYSFSNGKLTLTAANGDEVRAEYSGSLSPTATPPIYAIAGTYRITGGTGRFSNASGTGTLQGIDNLQTGQGQLQLSGTISY
ncbi:MAG: hypothetical protein ACR2GP_10015 [Burkholderiaceae bacterium]